MTEPRRSASSEKPLDLDALEKSQRRWVLRLDRSVRAMTMTFFVLLIMASFVYVGRLWDIVSPALFR